MDKDTLRELGEIESKLNELLPRLSKHKVRGLKELILRHYIRTYNIKSLPAKYGTLNRGFTSEELEVFLHSIDNPKYSILFSMQAYLGLRIGEAVRININDIKGHELRILTEKARVLNTLLVPSGLYARLMDYIKENEAQINRAQGYLFFADETAHSRRKEPFLNENYVRKVFRGYIQEAGLYEQYATSEESVAGRPPRRLARLTTHSLRHYAITKFSKQTNGNLILTSRFARHLKPETTLTYIHSDKSELYEYVEKMVEPLKVLPRGSNG